VNSEYYNVHRYQHYGGSYGDDSTNTSLSGKTPKENKITINHPMNYSSIIDDV
jgi:hypothetical protein